MKPVFTAALFGVSTLCFAGSLEQENIKMIENATGETPIRFVYCYPNANHCEVLARFQNIVQCTAFLQFFNQQRCEVDSTYHQTICRDKAEVFAHCPE